MFLAGIFSVIGVTVVYTASTNGQFLAGKMVNAFGLGIGQSTPILSNMFQLG
jgi:hypothetical protein